MGGEAVKGSAALRGGEAVKGSAIRWAPNLSTESDATLTGAEPK